MSKKESAKICVVVPAYNEAAVIGDVITRTKTAFKKAGLNATIVVVNDSSADDTSAIAARAGAVVIDHILNSGAGGATATGLSYADQNLYDVAVTMDADGQHDSADVVAGVKRLLASNTDLLIGSRLINKDGMSKLKILGNKGLSFITFALFGINSTDSQSGLRVFSRHALKNLRWKTSGYEFCSEMLWRAKQQNLVIGEYPIKAIYTDYSMNKGQNNWNGINIVKSLLRRRILEMFE